MEIEMTEKLEWLTIDMSMQPANVQEAYEYYVDLRKRTAKAKEIFETAFDATVDVPAGGKIVHGYNFGRFSIALVDDDGRGKAAPKTKAEPISLQAWIDRQSLNGRRI